MSLTITPRQLVQRAQFYQQFGQLMSAGIPAINTLETIGRSPPAASFREPIQRMLASLSQGATITDAMEHLGRWMPAFDLALIHAGEVSGRLDVVCRLLADYYSERAVVLRRMLSDLMYPAFVFHMAIFLFPFIDFFSTGNLMVYLVRTFGIIIPVYLAVYLLIYASQGKRGLEWRARLERVLAPIPVLGSARKALALARLAAALEALLNAGVNVIQAWDLASVACGSPAIARTVEAWKPELANGKTPSELVNASTQFPELFANLYYSGEVSGKLDDTLGKLREMYQEEGSFKLHLLGQWVPRGLYLMVAVLVGYKVISFYAGYIHEIGAAGNF